MPPLYTARLAAFTPDLRWNPFVILPVFCSLVIILVLATRKWSKTRQNGAFATQHRLKEDKWQDFKIQPQAKSDDTAYFDISASQPFFCVPPPESTLSSESRAGQTPPFHVNSGILAAQAMAKLEPDSSLSPEAEIRHPWRRHSDPLSKAIREDATNVSITRSTNQYFDDADSNGFWRRRTLEFA